MDINLLLEEKRFVYDPNQFAGESMDNYHFIVIGAGGTGGYLIPNLGRMIGIQNEDGSKHSVTIVDADKIENKNLLRQNFSPNDVGKNKAEVMASRYGRAFGQTFYYLPEYIESAEQVLKIMESESKVPVIIDCVDNNKTRFIIKEGINLYHQSGRGKNTISLSSGNEKYSGQVVFSYRITNALKRHYKYEEKSPDLIDIFPNMEVDRLPTEISCAEQSISAPQNIHTNMTAADILFGFVNRLLTNREVDTLAYFFDSQTMMRNSYSGRPTHVKQLLKLVDKNANYAEYFNDYGPFDGSEILAPTYDDVLKMVEEEDELIEVSVESIKKDNSDIFEQSITSGRIPF